MFEPTFHLRGFLQHVVSFSAHTAQKESKYQYQFDGASELYSIERRVHYLFYLLSPFGCNIN